MAENLFRLLNSVLNEKIVPKVLMVIVLIGLLGTTFIKIQALNNNQLNVHHAGDEGPRVIDSKNFSDGHLNFTMSDFLDTHPPFDTISRGSLLLVFEKISSLDLVQNCILISILILFRSFILVYFLFIGVVFIW